MVAERDSPVMSESDEPEDSAAHRKLLDGIFSTVRSQYVGKAVRTEPAIKRTEFSLVKSSFGTEQDEDQQPKGTTGAVKLDDLLGILKKTNRHTEVELRQVTKKQKILRKPLEKPVADRIQRETLYGNAQKNLDKWEPIITASEVAPQTVFPLQYSRVGLANEVPRKLSQYRVKSDLMKAMEELDKKYQQEDSGDEAEEDKYTLTLEEMREKRKEAARQKIRESYQIAKGRRKNKIKSKKFHKLIKREKIRAQIKQFEELQKTDPEAALKQLELIEKQRFQERATLRHKNTGAWAKNMQIRAMYDMDVRKELSEQLSIGRELMAKRVGSLEDDEESSESGEEGMELEEQTVDGNPWVQKPGKHEEEANLEYSSGYRKYWEQRNQVTKEREKLAQSNEDESDGEEDVEDENDEESDEESEEDEQLEVFKKKIRKTKAISTTSWQEEDADDSSSGPVSAKKKASIVGKKKRKVSSKSKELNLEEMFDDAEDRLQEQVKQKLSKIRREAEPVKKKKKKAGKDKKKETSNGLDFKKKASMADADVELDEGDGDQNANKLNIPSVPKDVQLEKGQQPKETAIDPNHFVQMKPKHLLNALPDMTTGGDLSDDEDPEHSRRLTIAEAFADEDIVADFEKEKEDERERNKPKEVDLKLPGWGSWGGSGIRQRKTPHPRRKMFKAPPVLPRRDDNKGRVIINEDAVNKKLGEHLVNELPFPFVTVKDYEASLRAPLGRTFVPETAHSTLVEPRVVTKIGAVIEPMKKDILMKDTDKVFKVGGKMYNGAVKKYEQFLKTKGTV
ncbi:U3 small nucleolar RNA-associated protein 14 homolog C-like isoform X2 [Uranotaenia lowii]|uniref:U3 small nucleolar RNA-associated protein 14 homolog C-like isoform X2 n=1 Tax=Uranotaenia lowii TaxID=190385 RepID=UPI00247A7C0E|nr:U3 small nucleolar RNA-associated protein 14 homolog C-like isoform X2 [Uranotaenia lowii]